MKKKNPNIIEWANLQVGDFIESNYNKMFCFKRDGGMLGGPSCLGLNKFDPKAKPPIAYVSSGILEYTRMKPTKSFIKLCKKLLDINYNEYHLDNLSYVEALAALKKYD